MDFSFSEDQENLRSSVRQFAKREIAPKIREMIKTRKIPDEIFKGLARMNLMGMTASEEYGGLGADAMTTGIVAEEIAKADPTMSIPVLFLVDNAWTNLINKYGTNELKSEILPDVAKGKSIVGIASTEPNFGSDIGSMTTVAKKNGSKYVLEGEKAFISLIRDIKERSGGFVTVAKTDTSKGTGGVSLFYLPYSDRLDISYTEEMGREGSSWGSFRFSGIELTAKHLLGKENGGFKIIMRVLSLREGS